MGGVVQPPGTRVAQPRHAHEDRSARQRDGSFERLDRLLGSPQTTERQATHPRAQHAVRLQVQGLLSRTLGSGVAPERIQPRRGQTMDEWRQRIELARERHLGQGVLDPTLAGSQEQPAMAAEKAGLKVEKKTSKLPLPEGLKREFRRNPRFERAFEALTPGRQRGYLHHFASAKQSATRTARIEKAMPAIFDRRGFLERG